MLQSTAPSLQAIHHFAFKCKDAEETRHFYEDILQLPMTMVVVEDDFRSTTGDHVSFAHFFFQMKDGNYIAFFDFGDGRPHRPDPETPLFTNHLALQVSNEEELLKGKERLESFGIEVQGPMLHEFVRSIYFWDPNGVRLEMAYTAADPKKMREFSDAARSNFDGWKARVARRRAVAAA
jgi:glyoxylase I family protein